MAKGQRQKTAKTTVTTVTSNGGGGRRGRRRNARKTNNPAATTRTITITNTGSNPRARNGRRRARRNRGRGPNTIHQTVTATLGTVGSNQGNSVETELIMLMNPALTKEATGSNQFGPIQMYAATYAQWRVTNVLLKATPIVGGSAVSGTVGRMSLNMTGNPTSASWSALGARPHVDLVPGKGGVLKLNHRNFPGPKEGWYNTNTKGDPNMSIGGAIEVHTLGKTMSTYQNGPFTGGLWLLEMTATWEFRNYNPQPGLLNMVKGQDDNPSGQAQITATAGQPIELEVPSAGRMARATAGSANNEVIWQVADTTVKTVTSVFPPPFNWLFKGGWWFIKRIAGAPVRAGTEKYRVYASIQDARADVPCIATQSATVPLTNAKWSYQQITPGNTGISDDTNAQDLVIDQPEPGQPFESTGRLQWLNYGNEDQQNRGMPASNVNTLSNNSHNEGALQLWTPQTGIGIKATNVPGRANNMVSMDIYDATFTYTFEGREVTPEMMCPYTIPVYTVHLETEGEQIGNAFAYCKLEGSGCQFVYILFKSDVTRNNFPMNPALNNNQTEIFAWHLSRVLTTSNTTSGVSKGRVWGGLKKQSLKTQIAPGRQITLLAGNYYVMGFASRIGKDKLVIGDLTIKAQIYKPDDQTNGIMAGGDWINGTSLQGGGWIPDCSGASLQWTPFTSDVVEVAAAWNTYALAPQALETIPEIDEEDLDYSEDSDTDIEARPYPGTPPPLPDEHWQNPPSLVAEKLTTKAKAVYEDLTAKGVPRDVARKVAQETSPHPAYVAWSDAYHDALVDGVSPPEARSVAWEKATLALGSRGHAE